MGLLEKIMDLFQSQKSEDNNIYRESKEEDNLDFDSLNPKLESKKNKINRLIKDINNKASKDLLPLIEGLESDVDILSDIDIKNKRDDEKLKQMTELGKKDYLESLNNLIGKLEDNDDIFSLNNEMNRFIKLSEKGYSRATLLIGREVENIVNDIKAIKKLIDMHYKSYIDLNNKLIKINEMLVMNDKRIEYEENFEEIKIKADKLEDNIDYNKGKSDELEKEINKLSKDEKFLKLDERNKEREKIEINLKLIRNKLDFILDKKAFEKYIYYVDDNKHVKLIEDYINNPLKGILNDAELLILEILKDIVNRIKNEEIIIKKPEKIIDKFQISRDELIEFKSNILKLNSEIENINNELEEIQRELPDLNAKIRDREIIENKIDEENKELSALNKKTDRLIQEVIEIKSELKEKYVQLEQLS